MSNKRYIIPVFVPHQGCPHDCVFCNQEEITGEENKVTPTQVQNRIKDYLTTIPSSAQQIEVAFYGGSFTGIEVEHQNKLLEAVQPWLEADKITGIRVSTRPDYIHSASIERLKKRQVETVELGVQSLDRSVLKAAGRGHNKQQVLTASRLLREAGFNLGLQIMPGLPGSSFASDLETGRQVAKLAPDFVRIYPTLVFKGTKLATLYHQGEYSPLDLKTAVELSAQLVKEFKKEEIPVIRIGLQPSTGVNTTQILAGPFHPSFRQLVDSYLMRQKVTNQLQKPLDSLTLKVNPKDSSVVRGQKNNNLEYLREKYQLNKIHIEMTSRLDRGEVKVNPKSFN